MQMKRLLVGCVLCSLAGIASAGTSILDTEEARTFRGTLDPLSAPAAWEERLQRWADNACQASADARHQSWQADQARPWSERAFPGEGLKDRLLAYPGSQLFLLVATDLVPARSRTNVYARVSQPYEDRLFNRIAASTPHSLEPEDILRFALEITGNDYRLAVLTAHSVLKETTKLGREAVEISQQSRKEYLRLKTINPDRPSTRRAYREYRKDFENAVRSLEHHNRVVRPLKSLRGDPTRIPDKMGPWYHIFALYTLDAVGGGGQALTAYAAEHGGKYFRAFQKEGGYEPEKKRIDEIFIKTQAACVPEWVALKPGPAPSSPVSGSPQEGFVTCPETQYPLMPAHQVKRHPFADQDGADYSPGKILREQGRQPAFKTWCRYGRVGKQIFDIHVLWTGAAADPATLSPVPYCSRDWNSYDMMGWNYVFESRKKDVRVQIGRRFEGGNNFSDPLDMFEREAAARHLLRQIEPLAIDCVEPGGSRGH